MFKDILQNVEGINTLPIFMLIFCFVFFLGVLFIVYRMDKKYASYMSQMPLIDSENEINIKEDQ